MAQDVTDQAKKGFDWKGTDKVGNPFLRTSTSWEAWQVGRWIAMTGRARPEDRSVWTSRGSTYRLKADDKVVRVHPNGEVTIVP